MTEQLARLATQLEKSGLARDGVSKWGQPAIRTVPAGHEPQRRMDASALQRRFVACAHGTPSPGTDLCASWVEQSFSRLGLGVVLGDAATLYNSYCPHRDPAELKVGMIVATGRHPYTVAGTRHGHVGIYIGDDQMMDCVADEVRIVPLELWLSAYGLMDEPRWGWLGSIGLS